MSRWRIYRERVVERLRRSSNHRVALVLADAGFGKSIALGQFLEGETQPCAFYRVPPATPTLLGFLRGLTESLEERLPGAYLSLTMAHDRALQSRAPHAELASWFVEHVREASLRIVIDDLHHATDESVVDFLARAIALSPPAVRWLIAMRPAKTFSAANWLAEGAMEWPVDEAVLRFTRQELHGLADGCGIRFTEDAFDEIMNMTQGWPSALGLALVLPSGIDSADSDTPPRQLYNALARAVFEHSDKKTQEFFLRSAVFTALDASMLSADDRATLNAAIDRSGIFIDRLREDAYRYDELFRSFLLLELQSRGDDAVRDAHLAAATQCERVLRWDEALDFHRKAENHADLRRILAEQGMSLVDAAAGESLGAALDALGNETLHSDPNLLALRAVLDSRFARFDTSEAWFRLAIHELKDDALRVEITFRYALDLLRRSRLDCIELIEPAVEQAEAIGHVLAPVLRSTLATAYVLADRFDEARNLIRRAVPGLRAPLPDRHQARGYHQASYVALRCGEIEAAERFARQALAIARALNLYDLAARAYSVLYEIAYLWHVDSLRALEYVENIASFALKSGDVAVREWALIAAYYIEAERGNVSMMSTIEKSLAVGELLQMTNETTTALLPGQALRACWSGDFRYAYRLLVDSAEAQLTPDRRALRWAELALYAAAGGLRTEAEVALGPTLPSLEQAGEGKLAVQAIVYALLALSLVGSGPERTALRRDARLRGARPALASLIAAADTLDARWHGDADYNEVLAALEAIDRAGFAGLARMIEALPAYPAREAALSM